ncbi:MAG TPA: hypothetical protein PL081_04485, partial [Pseudomonadales bacterium]|nr:hypothetical protein [Pseudomonadales bacterium]
MTIIMNMERNMQSKSINSLKGALGVAFLSGSLAGPVLADTTGNPFVANDLGSGYQVAEKG